MGYIYKITNKIDGKSYVGQSLNDPKIRWKQHFRENSGCICLRNAIQKYGKENFKTEIICICFDEDINFYEIEYIEKFNTISPNGYNLQSGGNNGRRLHEDTKKKLSNTMKKVMNNEDIKKKLSESTRLYYSVPRTKVARSEEFKKNLSDKLKGRKLSEEDKQNKRKNAQKNIKNIVEQYTLDGVLLNTFNGTGDAARSLGLFKGSISHVCNGKLNSTGGFKFKYVPINEGNVDEIKYKIEQYNFDGLLLNTYDSVKEASEKLNTSDSSIYAVCKGRRKSHIGFIFKKVPINNI